MKCHNLVVVHRLVDVELAFLQQIVGVLKNVLRHRIIRIQKIKRSGQCIEKTVGHTPGMSAFSEYDAFDSEILCCLTDSQRHLPHVLVAADKHAEIGCFTGVGTDRPVGACLVENFRIANQSIHMRLGKKVGGRRHQKNLGTFFVKRQFYGNTCIIFNIFFNTFQGIRQRRARQAKIVANLEYLANNFITVFLANTDPVHDFASGHGNFSSIDAVRTKN